MPAKNRPTWMAVVMAFISANAGPATEILYPRERKDQSAVILILAAILIELILNCRPSSVTGRDLESGRRTNQPEKVAFRAENISREKSGVPSPSLLLSLFFPL